MLNFLKKNTSLPTKLRLGGRSIPLVVKRHHRAKHICLRVNTKDHAISLTLPKRAPVKDGVAFLKKKHAWLNETIATLPDRTPVGNGELIPFLGRTRRIDYYIADHFHMRLLQDRLEVYGPENREAEYILRGIKEAFREEARGLLDDYADAIGKHVRRFSVRDPRTRWGSCSAKGDISLSWRLAFAPKPVLEYVIAHEVAHLRHLNHSLTFWDLVETLCPNYERQSNWLRTHGNTLFQYCVV